MVSSLETSCLNASLGKSPRIREEKSSMGLSTPISRASTSQAYLDTQVSFFLCRAGSIILIILELIRKLKKCEQDKVHNLYTEIQAYDLC